MCKIIVRNPNTKLPLGSWYPEEEEKLIAEKLLVVVCILRELYESREKNKRLKNHPIHDFYQWLWEVATGGMIQVGQLELLLKDVQDVADDFKRSRNAWVKERTSTALRIMNEIIDGNYTIDKSIYKNPSDD